MWLPSSIIMSSTGPFASRARRSASLAGTMRSSRPFTINNGQVMFCATPSSDSVLAFLRASSGVLQWLRTRKARRVNSGNPSQPAPQLNGPPAAIQALMRLPAAAETDAPHADPVGIEVGPFLHKIDHGLHRHLVVAANRKVILRFALTGTFEDQGRDSARKKWRLVGVSFLFCGVEADRHHQNGWPVDTDRLAQDAGHDAALIGNLDALAGGAQVRKCSLPAFDLLLVRGFHLSLIVHEQEGRKMIVDAGALEALTRGEEMFFRQRLTAQL